MNPILIMIQFLISVFLKVSSSDPSWLERTSLPEVAPGSVCPLLPGVRITETERLISGKHQCVWTKETMTGAFLLFMGKELKESQDKQLQINEVTGLLTHHFCTISSCGIKTADE